MLWFVIPALNERQSMPHLAETLSGACASLGIPFRVVLVDDGSTDGTAETALEVFGEERCSVIRFAVNRGPGAAMDAGFRYVVEQAAADDPIVTLEADGTSDLGILGRLLEVVRSGHDLALASPYAAGGDVLGTSLFRHFLSRIANYLCSHWLGIHGVSTYSSFYRVHSREILERTYRRYGEHTIRERGFTYAVEMLTKMVRTGARVAEVPMVLDANRRIGKSRMPVVRTTLRYLAVFARLGPAFLDAHPEPPGPDASDERRSNR